VVVSAIMVGLARRRRGIAHCAAKHRAERRGGSLKGDGESVAQPEECRNVSLAGVVVHVVYTHCCAMMYSCPESGLAFLIW
jgi:hypothetical protein